MGCRLHRTTLLVLNRQDAKSAKGICNITAKHAKIAKEVLKLGSSKVLKLGCRLTEPHTGDEPPRRLCFPLSRWLIIRLSRMIEECKWRGEIRGDHAATTPRMPGNGAVLIQNGPFGHPAWRTTCASGFECADLDALSTAGPGPRRRGNCQGIRNAKGNFKFEI